MRMLLDSTPENDIAERLRLWRKTALELTQKEFAEATGVHLSAIRKYENRNSVPSSESLLAIASTGIDLHWLLTGEGDMRTGQEIGERGQYGRCRRSRSRTNGNRRASTRHPRPQALRRPG
ncbi:MAG: helix-turn-helix transcriptional regulator [Sulfuritalea sp.]|nr:helix-turn-helix transcriptional regulator [Sulfuritalea sp.]